MTCSPTPAAEAAYLARMEAAALLRAHAARVGIPTHIKASGRWCFLREISATRAIYSAPRKAQRTRAANHQPLLLDLTHAEAAAQAPASPGAR